MALKCYDNACSIQNILRRLNKVADNIGKENIKGLLKNKCSPASKYTRYSKHT